nr:ribonuclease H-like domain, reverse transcriptase, RNA-dependent DNA polymerase [Tanacetum cinerariifolium]
MVAYLNKSDASEGFDQIIDFLSGSYIKYALTINPYIYVSCIKQFWNIVVVKQSNDVNRLQALVDKKKVVITEATIRDALRLDDAKGVDCLPNEEIFTELARMGYEKPSTKLTFYKDFFSSQWKFLIHTILQSLSAKRTSWNEFSSAMASAIEEQGDAEEQVQDDIDDAAAQRADTADLPSISQVQHTPPPSPLPQSQPPQQAQPQAADFPMGLLQEALNACAALARRVEHLEYDKVAQALAITKLKRRVKQLERGNKVKEVVDVVTTAKLITEVVTAASITIAAAEPQVPAATITAAPVRVDVASTRKRKGVVIRDLKEESTAIIPADTKSKDKGKGIMIEEPKPMKKKQQVDMDEEYARKLHEELNKDIDWDVAIDHVKQKAKEDPYVQRYQVIKKRPQTEAQARRNMIMYLKNFVGFRLDYFKGMSYDDIHLIFEAKFNSNIEFLLKSKEHIEEEENRAIQSINETPTQKAAKRRNFGVDAAMDHEENTKCLMLLVNTANDKLMLSKTCVVVEILMKE